MPKGKLRDIVICMQFIDMRETQSVVWSTKVKTRFTGKGGRTGPKITAVDKVNHTLHFPMKIIS